MTSREEEIKAQRGWKLKSGLADYSGFDDLIITEFIDLAKQRAMIDKRVSDLVAYCARQVPYYRDRWNELDINLQEITGARDLTALPILTKQDLQAHGNDLLAQNPPRGHEAKVKIKSSGTTGQPSVVAHSAISRSFNTLLKQRQLRWFRYDPMGLLAQIRPAQDLPPNPKGEQMSPGDTCFANAWPLIGQAFHTGKFVGLDDASKPEDKVAWLEKHQPDYLLGQSAQLEQLALVAKDFGGTFRLKGIEAISQQLTADMTELIESVFGTTVYMNYGLNEVGIVAARCPEGNRYHIHSEHCITEIVDDDGKPCKPGEVGRLLVTAYGNLAMPLVRYDTDDLAEVSDGACPCGRTLPTFREIHGRYRRTALLPPGVWDCFISLQRCINQMSMEELRNLQQYQLKHHRDGTYLLRIVTGGELHPAFEKTIRESWHVDDDGNSATLSINIVDEIERPSGGKFQNFVSEFFPDYQTAPSGS